VKTNHFSKQQCSDMYEFSIVYKVYFFEFVVRQLCIESIFMSIFVYFVQNYTVLKLFQFIYGISSDGYCCQWSVFAINRPSGKCCRHM